MILEEDAAAAAAALNADFTTLGESICEFVEVCSRVYSSALTDIGQVKVKFSFLFEAIQSSIGVYFIS